MRTLFDRLRSLAQWAQCDSAETELFAIAYELDRLARERDAAVGLLRELEWSVEDGNEWYCPACREHNENGHKPDCRLAALLRPAGEPAKETT